MKYQILIDNQPVEGGHKLEYGFSAWVEAHGKKILFDVGLSRQFADNAALLGLDLDDVDYIILSHGHRAHTGGLPALIDIKKKTKIFMHPAVFASRYSKDENGNIRNLSMPEGSKKFLAAHRDQIVEVIEPLQIDENIGLTGSIPRKTDFENNDPGEFYFDEKCTIRDNIVDDIALWIDSAEGIYIFTGCAHSGIVNIVKHVQKIRSGRIHKVIGGIYMSNATKRQIDLTRGYLVWLGAELDIYHYHPDDIANELVSDEKDEDHVK